MRGKRGAVLIVMLCFAANSVATRWLVGGAWLDAGSVTLARFAAGALVLALLARRESVPAWRDAPLVAALGAYAVLIGFGYVHIGAAAGTFVFYALVVTTMTLGGPRPTPRAIAGALVALGGVGVLAWGRVEGATTLGVLMLAGTGVAWGAYSLLLRRRGAPIATNARAFLVVALLSAPLPALATPHVSAIGLAVALAMGALTTALAYALWARVLPSLTPLQAGTAQLLVPILAAAGGVLLLAEPLSPRLLAAGALVVGGIGLTLERRAGRAGTSDEAASDVEPTRPM